MPLSERKKEVYRWIPPGGNWCHLSESTRKQTMGRAYVATGGKSGWWRRLAWDRPSATILGMPDHSSTALIHPDEIRCMSVNECAALQSFPPGTEFCGRTRSQYQQIGNAVPPLLGQALGEQLARFLDGEREESQPPVPAWRQTSANRRPGTHGWTVAKGYHLMSRFARIISGLYLTWRRLVTSSRQKAAPLTGPPLLVRYGPSPSSPKARVLMTYISSRVSAVLLMLSSIGTAV